MNRRHPIQPTKMAEDIFRVFTEQFKNNRNRSLQITRASCIGNLLIGIGKLGMGIFSMSFFTCVSAFYTFGTVAAKSCALAGLLRENDLDTQYRYYRLSGTVLIAASLLYILYSIRLFFHPTTAVFHPYVAMAIATFTFAEIGINIRGVIVERHNHLPLIHAIKMINLASSFICIVLTHTAILSFASDQSSAHPQANGIIGVIMGILAMLVGIAMIRRINALKKEESRNCDD